MNTSQIDHADTPARIVGYAVGAELKRKLDEGFLCGGWSPTRKGYAVLRQPMKRGRKSRLTAEQQAEALILRTRLEEIAAAAGISYHTLGKRLVKLRRQA